MANARAGGVQRIDTTGSITGNGRITGILYIPGSGSPSAQVQNKDASGMVMWEATGATRLNDHFDWNIVARNLYVTLAGTGTVLYLYFD